MATYGVSRDGRLIDEAFERAGANFAHVTTGVLVAFSSHMVLVTPLEILQTLEPYLGGIGLVENRGQKHSNGQAVTIGEAA
ncbi:MAG: hypothetical protein LBO75_01780 [Bifidobacteriaceae bacterium]|jgi:uncharacterized protein YPO0396|nr:hypothetical protein [Bifidobacteriaceae bacterium]